MIYKRIQQNQWTIVKMFYIPQFESTCWFNALLMSLFYSELMRKIFIKELPLIRQKLSIQPKVNEIFEDLLFNNYKVNAKNNQNFYNTLRS